MTSSFHCREFKRRVASPCGLGMARYGCGCDGCRKPATAVPRKKPGGGGLRPGPRPRVTDAITREERDHRPELTQTVLPTNREQPPPRLPEPGARAQSGESWSGDVDLFSDAVRLDGLEVLRRFRSANREQAELPEEAQDSGEDGIFPFLRLTADIDDPGVPEINIPHDLELGTGGGEEAGEPCAVVDTLPDDGFGEAVHHDPGAVRSLPPPEPDDGATAGIGSDLHPLIEDWSEELLDLGPLGLAATETAVPWDMSGDPGSPGPLALDATPLGLEPGLLAAPSGAAPARDPLAHLFAGSGPVGPPALDPLGPGAGLPDPFSDPAADPLDPLGLDPFPPDLFGGLP